MKKSRPIKATGRKRRAAGWTLLTLGLVVAGVWLASGWWTFGAYRSDASIRVLNGAMRYSIESPRETRIRWSFVWQRTSPPGISWRALDSNLVRFIEGHDYFVVAYASAESPKFFATAAWIALWPIPLLLWTPAALLLRSGILARRRVVKGMCAKCGYSLAGLGADSLCPECGTVLSGVQRMKAGSEDVRSTGPLQPPDGSST